MSIAGLPITNLGIVKCSRVILVLCFVNMTLQIFVRTLTYAKR